MSSSGGSRKQNERGSPRGRGNSSRDGKGRKKDSPRNKPSVTNQTISATTRTASGSANPPANSPCPQQPAHNPPPWTSSAPPFTAHFQTTSQPSFPPTAASQPDFAFFDSLTRFPDASASYYGTVGAVSVEGSRLPPSVLEQQLQSQHQHQQVLRFHHQQAFERQQYQQQFLQFQCQRLFQPAQQHQHQPQPHQHVFQPPQPPPSQQTASFPANPSLTFRQPETDPFSGAPDVPRSYSGGGFPAPAFPQMNPAAGGQFLPPAPFMDSLRGPIDDPSPRGPVFPSPHPNAAPSPFFNQLPSYQTLPPALAPASAPSAPPPAPAHPPLAQHVIPQPPHPPPSLSLSSVNVLPPDHFSLVPLPEGSFSQTNSTASSPSGMYAMTNDLTSMSLVTPSNQQPGFFATNSGMSLVKVENDLASQSNPLSPSSPGELLSPPLTPAPAAPSTPSQRKRRQDPVKREPSEHAEKKVQAPSIRIRAESNRCTEITVPVAQPGENKAVHRFTVSVGKDPEQFQVHCNAIGAGKARIVVTSSREYATTHNFSRLHRMLLDCVRERLRQAGAYAPITVYEYATAEDALRASDQSYRSASDDEEAPEPIKTTCFKLTTYKKQ